MNKVSYEEIRGQLQTGDVVLFKGKGWISWLIEKWCSLVSCGKRVKSSHVGWLWVERGRVLLHESTMIRGGFKGVRLIPFSEVVETYSGRIWIRHLQTKRTPSFMKKFKAFVSETLGKPYEEDPFQLIRSCWFFTRSKKEDKKSYFCSELVAAGFKELGLICTEAASNDFAPYEFEQGSKIDSLLAQKGKASLSEEIEIVRSKSKNDIDDRFQLALV